MRHLDSAHAKRLTAIITFGTAFGYVEAAVVYYLRALMHFHQNYVLANYHVLVNLGFVTFIAPTPSLIISTAISYVEVAREAATIVILITVAYAVGHTRRQRWGAFWVAFAAWDITYYVWLKVLANWPHSFLTQDIFFLIPVPWIGPVATPIIISTALLIWGAYLYLTPGATRSAP